jgi:hypothetical protein
VDFVGGTSRKCGGKAIAEDNLSFRQSFSVLMG